ncbi:hypothetical protein [Actinomyces procaprae]|uniref:hypothetical protein n=1 Tax=Actinomyces procaprae TaxID=2560010 RepID=UPI0010A22719|nr:hypothetical protein [Actinomyces procaprae]
MTVPPSLWLDAAPASSRRAALQASAQQAAQGMPSWVLGTVTATSADDTTLPAGWVRVAIPADAPVSEATGMTDGGLSAVGATVRVTLDSTGRVTGISSPITIPAGADAVATGVLGERIAVAMSDAAHAFEAAEEIRATAEEAFDRSEAVAGELASQRAQWESTASAVGSLSSAVDGLDGRLEAARMVADDAQAVASAARSAADAAQVSADSAASRAAAAQSAADSAAQSALVGGIVWTSGWWVNAETTRTASEISTSTSATSGTTGRIGTHTRPLPGGRTYRLAMTASAAGDARIEYGLYYMDAAGAYKRSWWPSPNVWQLAAGTKRALLHADLPVSYRTGETQVQVIAYLRAGGQLLTVHSATITDVTDISAAQAAAERAQARADQAGNLAASAEAAAGQAEAAAAAAQAQAETATTDAERAQAAASAAQATAAGAQAASDTAAARAAAAQAEADSARAAAEQARAAADRAQDSADRAQDSAGQAQDSAGQAQGAADSAAQSALVGGIVWTSSWQAGSTITLTASAATTSNTATSGNITNRLLSQYAPLPGGRTYRVTATVSAEADAGVDMGAYYGTAAGAYVRSLWPDDHLKAVPAGTVHGTYSQDVTVDYTGTAQTLALVIYLRAGGAALTVHRVTIIDVTDLLAAQKAADDAAAVAVTAKAAADAAAASALGAQATADAATAKATTASGLYTVSSSNPSDSDGDGKPAGAIWEVRSGGTSLRRYVWGGSAWVQIKAGTDFIGSKAVGRAQIGDAAVGTAQVADASITDAKIGSLSVSKLTVTDGATIPVAVMNAILADQAFLGRVLATSLSVTSDNLLPDPYYDTTTALWTGSSADYRSETTYQGHPYAYRMVQRAAGASSMTLYGPILQEGARVPCTPGDRILASSMWYCDGAMPTTGSGFSTQVYFYDSAKRLISGAAGNQTCKPQVPLTDHPVGQWFRVGGEVPVTVPDGAAYMTVRPTLYFAAGTTPTEAVAYVGHVDVHRQTPAVDITDGAVTAAKIQASEEMWSKIGAFAAVTTDMLTAGDATITGTAVVGDLVGNTLRGGRVIAGSGTDGTVQAGDTDTGFGVSLSTPSAGSAQMSAKNTGPYLIFRDSSGAETFYVDGAGNFRMKDRVRGGTVSLDNYLASWTFNKNLGIWQLQQRKVEYVNQAWEFFNETQMRVMSPTGKLRLEHQLTWGSFTSLAGSLMIQLGLYAASPTAPTSGLYGSVARAHLFDAVSDFITPATGVEIVQVQANTWYYVRAIWKRYVSVAGTFNTARYWSRVTPV